LGQFKGYIDAAVFQQKFDQFIEFTFGQWAENPGLNNMLGLGFKSLNTGSAKVQGAELSIMGTGEIRPGTNIDLLVGYTYTKPTSTTPNFNYATRAMDNPFILPIFSQTNYTSTSSDPSNNILKYRMQHLIRGDVSLRQAHWHIGFSSRYNSHMQNIDNAFEKLEFYFPKDFNPGIIQWRESHQKGDWIFDARAGLNWNRQQLTISVNNLTNRLYAIRPLAIESTRLINIQYSIEL
jgi:outer membrane receptor protein involved in Fe transport